jgi:hypothetical protein
MTWLNIMSTPQPSITTMFFHHAATISCSSSDAPGGSSRQPPLCVPAAAAVMIKKNWHQKQVSAPADAPNHWFKCNPMVDDLTRMIFIWVLHPGHVLHVINGHCFPISPISPATRQVQGRMSEPRQGGIPLWTVLGINREEHQKTKLNMMPDSVKEGISLRSVGRQSLT